jgi:hypothetical protein
VAAQQQSDAKRQESCSCRGKLHRPRPGLEGTDPASERGSGGLGARPGKNPLGQACRCRRRFQALDQRLDLGELVQLPTARKALADVLFYDKPFTEGQFAIEVAT